jgi:peptidoglycan pentaglycine glycine transferase (the first glycine)
VTIFEDTVTDPVEWLEFLERAPGAGVYHCEEWGRILGLTGWRTRIVAIREDGKIVAGCLLATKKIPGLGRQLGLAPRGLLLDSSCPPSTLERLLARIRRESREQGVVFVRLGAPVPRSRDGQPVEEGMRLIGEFQRLGCRYAEGFDWSTLWVELEESDDVMLARMNVHTRRHIRASEREGIEVLEGNSPEDIERFYRLHAGLYRAKGIGVTPETTISLGARALVEGGRATVFWAYHEGKPINGALVSLCGVPRLLWGARDMEASAKISASSGSLLHWRIMQSLRTRGKRLYDLGGSPAFELPPDHPNYGVWRFKKGLGGSHVDLVDQVRLVLSPALAAIHDRLIPIYHRLFAVSPFYKGHGEPGGGD